MTEELHPQELQGEHSPDGGLGFFLYGLETFNKDEVDPAEIAEVRRLAALTLAERTESEQAQLSVLLHKLNSISTEANLSKASLERLLTKEK